MKYIRKACTEPTSLIDWKAQDKMYQRGNATWQRFRTVNEREYKKEFTQDLIVEQGYICCYCEQKLNTNDCHIEHLHPQSKDEYSAYLFDYQNLLCSCQLEIESGEPRHCGNSKCNNIISITPLMPDCESKFKYTYDGQILHTDEDSELTIKHLQLDIDKLNDLRKNAIEPFIIDPETFEEITQEDARTFAEKYLKKNNGQYNEFYTTIKYLFS